MYYTDCLPPLDVLSEFPNWKSGGVEGRKGCHEGTIWNRGPYDNIHEDVELSAGDVYFADGSSAAALIEVLCDMTNAWATELRIYQPDDGKQFWGVERDKTGLWHYQKFTKKYSVPLDDPDLFPLKYCTHLLSEVTGKTISGTIEIGGGHADWDTNDLWG